MKKRTRLGLNGELYCSPVFHGLTSEPAFECTFDVVAKNAIKMRERDLDGAFLSPVDYARESSDYCIIPNIAVSSRTPTDTVVLHFKEGLHTVKTLAVHPTSTSEIVLASILLSEQFNVRPQILPVMGSLDRMLQSADAALLVGNAAMEQAQARRNRIDLVEEWFDMTGLPYVHGFWCLREADMERDDIISIQHACERGIKALAGINETEVARQTPRFSPNTLKQYLESFSFVLADEEQEALTEFIRYAYYHGVLPDVAELNFYPVDKKDESPYADFSLN
jgi:chorismate dehydratase